MKPIDNETAGAPKLPPVKPMEPYAPQTKPALKVNGALVEKPVKKSKPAKLTRSKAAELKDAIEKGQVGKPDAVDKIKGVLLDGNTGKPVPAAKKEKGAKPKQLDMVDEKMVKLDQRRLGVLGKAGTRLAKAVTNLADMVEEKGKAMENMVKAMQKAKRYRYTCAGLVFELTHKGPQDTIKVVKPK